MFCHLIHNLLERTSLPEKLLDDSQPWSLLMFKVWWNSPTCGCTRGFHTRGSFRGSTTSRDNRSRVVLYVTIRGHKDYCETRWCLSEDSIDQNEEKNVNTLWWSGHCKYSSFCSMGSQIGDIYWKPVISSDDKEISHGFPANSRFPRNSRKKKHPTRVTWLPMFPPRNKPRGESHCNKLCPWEYLLHSLTPI